MTGRGSRGDGDDAVEQRADEVDRNFKRLLEGLRTTLPGAQVLLGFLLIVPFQRTFGSLSTFERYLYEVAFFSSAMSSVLLIAPSVHQRFRAPISGIEREDEAHVDVAVWVSLIGTIFLGLAVTAATWLVGSVVGETPFSIAATGAVSLAVVYTWALQPLVQFRNR